jgi:hypothetical protein
MPTVILEAAGLSVRLAGGFSRDVPGAGAGLHGGKVMPHKSHCANTLALIPSRNRFMERRYSKENASQNVCTAMQNGV